MATVKQFRWSNQNKQWELIRVLEVTETVVIDKYSKSEKLSNQDETQFFIKFDCYKSNNEFIGSILSLNPNLFI